jgi:hypothetical protein
MEEEEEEKRGTASGASICSLLDKLPINLMDTENGNKPCRGRRE